MEAHNRLILIIEKIKKKTQLVLVMVFIHLNNLPIFALLSFMKVVTWLLIINRVSMNYHM